jgi:hypothetical protein
MCSLIRDLPLGVFSFVTALPLVASIALIVTGLRARQRAALIKATPTSNIGMATEGYCEFKGRVEAIDGRTINAPLTLWPCVWYHAKVEKGVRRSTDGKGVSTATRTRGLATTTTMMMTSSMKTII